MSTLDRATDIRLNDGVLISVHSPGAGLVIVSTPADDASEASGLAALRSTPIGTSAMAMHSGMPVEIVRAYARAHGGVAEIGETAQRLLKSLPSRADPLPIDALTPAVIAARRVVAAGTRVGPDRFAALAALVVVTDARYSAHPLRDEGERLRAMLSARAPEAA